MSTFNKLAMREVVDGNQILEGSSKRHFRSSRLYQIAQSVFGSAHNILFTQSQLSDKDFTALSPSNGASSRILQMGGYALKFDMIVVAPVSRLLLILFFCCFCCCIWTSSAVLAGIALAVALFSTGVLQIILV